MADLIYEPKGKAKEYCDLALNLYRGCSHGCKYCYAPAATYCRDREVFDKAKPRDISGLAKEVAVKYRFEKPTSPILLCFTCDPYQPAELVYLQTRKALEILKGNGLKVSILSKGGRRSERDLGLLGEGDQFGATLTFTNQADSLEWEPKAAKPSERFEALQHAHDKGLRTWASLEPVIDPEQTLEIIRQTHGFVDKFKVGKWNHDKRAARIDWAKFGREAVILLENLGCKYYIKEDLRRYL